MYQLVMLILIISMISALLLGLAFMLSQKSFQDNEKLSPFECGFIPAGTSRGPFSLQFFLICMIFLIFDIELILLYPFLSGDSNISYFPGMALWVFILMLSGGLILEWSQAKLEWFK